MEMEQKVEDQRRNDANEKYDQGMQTLQSTYTSKLQQLNNLKSEAVNREDYDKVPYPINRICYHLNMANIKM